MQRTFGGGHLAQTHQRHGAIVLEDRPGHRLATTTPVENSYRAVVRCECPAMLPLFVECVRERREQPHIQHILRFTQTVTDEYCATDRRDGAHVIRAGLIFQIGQSLQTRHFDTRIGSRAKHRQRTVDHPVRIVVASFGPKVVHHVATRLYHLAPVARGDGQ
jgi:hypothetical protein